MALSGYRRENDLADVLVITDNHKLAIDKLEFLLKNPGSSPLTVEILKIDPNRVPDVFQSLLTNKLSFNIVLVGNISVHFF